MEKSRAEVPSLLVKSRVRSVEGYRENISAVHVEEYPLPYRWRTEAEIKSHLTFTVNLFRDVSKRTRKLLPCRRYPE